MQLSTFGPRIFFNLGLSRNAKDKAFAEKIPEFTFRDSKKAACLMQDKSFLVLIEKSSVNEDIFSRMKRSIWRIATVPISAWR